MSIKDVVIDPSAASRFVIEEVADPDGSACIVQAVVNIAAARNMTATAEGVETNQQRNMLRKLGCTEMQGFLFSPALPAADIHRLLLSLHHAVAGAEAGGPSAEEFQGAREG